MGASLPSFVKIKINLGSLSFFNSFLADLRVRFLSDCSLYFFVLFIDLFFVRVKRAS